MPERSPTGRRSAWSAQGRGPLGGRVEGEPVEVYVDNDAHKALRPPQRAYRLQTEPWLFVIAKNGRVAARLEGSFGLDAFERAVVAGIARSG